MKVLVFTFFLVSCANLSALDTVDYVDVDRYMGKWFEIGKYPNSFQKNCSMATATYSLKASGDVKVINTCISDKNGKLKESAGNAWIVDKDSNAKLKVQFFLKFFKLPFFAGNYWIIMLGDDYEYVVVSEPKKEYLWILSKTEKLPKETLDYIQNELDLRGFDLEKIKYDRL